MSKVLGNIDLDDEKMWRNPQVRQAICLIAGQYVATHLQQYVDDWQQRQGDLLKISDQELSFFGGYFRVVRNKDGSLAISMRDIKGKVVPVTDLSLTLNGLDDMLRRAALLRLQRIEYEAIAREAGLPNIEPHEAFCYGHSSLDPQVLDKVSKSQFGPMVDQAVKAVRRLIRPCDADLARRCQPRRATLEAFNFVMQNRQTIRQLNKEAPHLLGLLYAAYREKKIDQVEDSAFKALKDCLVKDGFSEAVWKTLAHMDGNHLRWLVFHFGFQKTARLADMVTKSQVVPPVPLLRRWVYDSGEGEPGYYYYRRFLPPAWFRRAAAMHANSLPADQVETFVDNEYANVCDWVRANPTRPDANQLRAGWKWIKRQSDEWQQRTSQRHVHRHLAWQSLVEEYTEGDYKVVPLVSSAALAEEGQKMHHCVGSYDHQCVSGYSRIFSFRDPATGKPLATAEIRLTGTGWQLSQVRGPCNAMVDQSVQNGVSALLRKYNRAHAALMAADADSDK